MSNLTYSLQSIDLNKSQEIYKETYQGGENQFPSGEDYSKYQHQESIEAKHPTFGQVCRAIPSPVIFVVTMVADAALNALKCGFRTIIAPVVIPYKIVAKCITNYDSEYSLKINLENDIPSGLEKGYKVSLKKAGKAFVRIFQAPSVAWDVTKRFVVEGSFRQQGEIIEYEEESDFQNQSTPPFFFYQQPI